jgi:small subunit ribosomal protein S4
LIAEGDIIDWREASTKSEYYKTLALEIKNRTIPEWLSLDMEKLIGKVLRLPTAEDIEAKFDEKAIVEYYSR